MAIYLPALSTQTDFSIKAGAKEGKGAALLGSSRSGGFRQSQGIQQSSRILLVLGRTHSLPFFRQEALGCDRFLRQRPFQLCPIGRRNSFAHVTNSELGEQNQEYFLSTVQHALHCRLGPVCPRVLVTGMPRMPFCRGDERDITLKGLDAIQSSVRIYLEAYTSILGVSHDRLVRFRIAALYRMSRIACP
jgi:hypothetical protein